MKRYIKHFLILTISLFLLGGCEEEYIAPTAEPNDSFVTTSFGSQESRLQINSQMDFADFSRGVVSRTWTFPEGVVELEDETSNTTSINKKVKATFMKSGIYEVKIEQIYAGDVFVYGENQGVNTYDTTFTVTVLDSIRANFEAMRVKEGTDLVNANGALNEVIASREVLLTSTSVGEPTVFNWIFTSESGKVAAFEGNPATAKFSSMEKYDMMLVASSPLGADTISYTNYMNVVPSTDPVDVVGISADENVISIEFSRDMVNPATNPLESITLNITNGGKTYTANVTGFTINSNAANVIDLALDADIFNSDIITLNYDADKGNLRTLDGVDATSIVDGQVIFVKENLLADANLTSYDYGFETSADDNWKYLWWGAPWDGYTTTISEAMSYDGDKSMLVTLNSAGGMIMGHKDAANANITFPLVGSKTYEVGCWVYMESLGDKTSIPDLRFYWTPNTDWGVGGAFFTDTWPEGKWVYSSIQISPAADADYTFMIRGDNQGNSQECKFYLDNITIAELDLRP